MTDIIVKVIPDTIDAAVVKIISGTPTGIGPAGLPGTDGADGLPGTDGADGLPGTDGADGLPGAGVAIGGTVGQILSKISGIDYDTHWIDNYTSEVKHVVKAAQSISKGQAVYVSGADGTNMIVSKAGNDTEHTSSKTMGLLQQSLSINGQGYVITEGLLSGLNTGTAQAGDPVWLGTNGNLLYGLANKPVAPKHLVFIGIVTRVQQNNGEIFVRPQNGFELNEIHDVLIVNPQPGDVLTFNGVLWVNQQPQ